MAVKVTMRVRVKLAQAPKPSQPDRIKARNHNAIRPFTPSFDPAIFTQYQGCVRQRRRLPKSGDDPPPKCEVLQLAMR